MTRLFYEIFNKKILIENEIPYLNKQLRENLELYMKTLEYTKQSMNAVIKIFPYKKIINNYKIMKLCEINYMDEKYRALIHHEHFIFIEKKKHTIYLFLKEDKKDEIFEFVENIVSNISAKLLELDNVVFLHASCVVKNGKAIAIVGPKNSGKTSIMCELLNNDYQMISNDKIGISFINNEVKVFGIPSSIGIRYNAVNKCFSSKNIDIMRKLHIFLEKNDMSEKFNISLKKFTYIFNRKIVNEAKLEIILTNKYIPEQEKLTCKKLDMKYYETFFKNQLVNAVSPSFDYIDSMYRRKKTTFDSRIYSNIQIMKIVSNENNILQLEQLLKKSKL